MAKDPRPVGANKGDCKKLRLLVGHVKVPTALFYFVVSIMFNEFLCRDEGCLPCLRGGGCRQHMKHETRDMRADPTTPSHHHIVTWFQSQNKKSREMMIKDQNMGPFGSYLGRKKKKKMKSIDTNSPLLGHYSRGLVTFFHIETDDSN